MFSSYFINISSVALEPCWGYGSIDGNVGFSFGSSGSYFSNYNVNMVNICSDASGYLHCHCEYVVNNIKHHYAVVYSREVQYSLTKLSSMAVDFVLLMLVYISDAASI